jgi:hypothetical protein
MCWAGIGENWLGSSDGNLLERYKLELVGMELVGTGLLGMVRTCWNGTT